MDSELEEELKEREATVAELAQAERNLHELEEKIAELKREKEERDREMEKVQVKIEYSLFFCHFFMGKLGQFETALVHLFLNIITSGFFCLRFELQLFGR